MPGDPLRCHGSGPDHCCYVEGEICPFLERETETGRRWTCGLFREHREAHPRWKDERVWQEVHGDPRYLAEVRPVWDRHGIADCGDFGPAEGQCCWGLAGRVNGWPDPVPDEAVNARRSPPVGVRWSERAT